MRLIPANRNRSRWCIATFGPSGCPLRTDFSSTTCLCREADSIQQWKIIQKKSQPPALPVNNQMQVTVD